MKEYILCASIHFDDGKKHPHQPKNIQTGFVVCGRRHHNCYTSVGAVLDTIGIDPKETKKIILSAGRDSQGFITNLDRHVGRKEAYLIAKESNQIVYGAGLTDKENAILISENLY